MSGDVKYEAERPKAGDWRWQEALALSPGEVMDELLSLSEAVLDARTEYTDANRELQQVQERLKTLEVKFVQEAVEEDEANKGVEGYESKVDGKNAEIRGRKEHLYLEQVPDIQGLRQQEWELQHQVERAQAAYDAFMDRQKNLHSWARMYSATVSLLATVERDLPYSYIVSVARAVQQPTVDIPSGGVEQSLVEVPSEESLAKVGISEGDVSDVQEAIKRYQKDKEKVEPVL